MQAKQHIQLNTTQSIQPLLAKFGIETADIMVESLVLDSREVAIHSAFIALKGHAVSYTHLTLPTSDLV